MYRYNSIHMCQDIKKTYDTYWHTDNKLSIVLRIYIDTVIRTTQGLIIEESIQKIHKEIDT